MSDPAPERETDESLDPLIDRMWRDADAGRLRPLPHYLRRCPTARAGEVERSYAEIMAPVATEPSELESATLPIPAAPGAQAGLPLRIGRYRVLSEMGGGGMGRLLLAEDPELGRRVVLKTLRWTRAGSQVDGALLERLRVEARVGGRLHHPNLCPVLDVVNAERTGTLYLVMPFIDGRPLAGVIDEARRDRAPGADRGSFWLSLGESAPTPRADSTQAEPGRPLDRPRSSRSAGELPALVRTMEVLSRAVHRLHEAGIVHRDLKPGNVMIATDGTPVVLDFGLALERPEPDGERRTLEGQVLGTPGYMAPE